MAKKSGIVNKSEIVESVEADCGKSEGISEDYND